MERLNLLLTDGPKLVYCSFFTQEQAAPLKKVPPIECQYAFEINITKESNKLTASFSVKTDSVYLPFKFDLKSQADFKFENIHSSQEITEQAAIIEAIPYIFPFVKELVADLTRKAYYKPFYLPPIDLKTENLSKTQE